MFSYFLQIYIFLFANTKKKQKQKQNKKQQQKQQQQERIGPLVLGSFGMKSARFQGQIPPWNLADFMAMKSSRFHDEIWQISWNPADFMMKFGKFHGKTNFKM